MNFKSSFGKPKELFLCFKFQSIKQYIIVKFSINLGKYIGHNIT
jgi:hypothetical protein